MLLSFQIAEYLSSELVTAIISPHLEKTSSFRQKEHFQYYLWGYPLNSDLEIFLNMRPDACSQIGRLMLDHLMAFRKIYQCNVSAQVADGVDDSCFDVDTLIDEEYQNVDEEEVQSLTTTEGGTVASADTESVYSVSTMYSIRPKLTKELRRNLFDVISKSSIHIRNDIKYNIRRITKGAKLSTKQVLVILFIPLKFLVLYARNSYYFQRCWVILRSWLRCYEKLCGNFYLSLNTKWKTWLNIYGVL